MKIRMGLKGFCKRRDLRVVMTILLMVAMVEGVVGTLHRVGDQMGWSQNVNYTEWASHRQFYLHDWLLFNFDKRIYSVLEVNKTSYQSCNDQGFIKNITRGGRDVYQLTQPRPYYFLSSGGFCWGGMKLAIVVQATPPAPAPAPPTNASPQRKGSGSPITPLLAALLVLLIASTF